MLLNEKNPHGGDIYTHKGLLDFSANINPFGIPEAVRKAAVEAVGDCTAYPDPYCRALRKRLSEEEGVPSEWILCCNGAADLIYSFAYSLPKEKPVLIVSPTFSEYETALTAAGIKAEHFMLSEGNGFVLDDSILNIDFSKYSALFVCSPNNPTGITVRPGLLTKLAETGIRLFCDMCFMDLTASPQLYDVPALLKKFSNLVILKAFTKSFAIPGIRLGYLLCGDEKVAGTIAQRLPEWNVSLPAQVAGIAAMDQEGYLTASKVFVKTQREFLVKGLQKLGAKVYPSDANFILFQWKDETLYEKLLSHGFMIRDCSDYEGLGKGYFRIAVKNRMENEALLQTMETLAGTKKV